MAIFQAPQSVLTPDANGDLVDVTGFKRAWTLADGTAVIQADSVVGGTQLRRDSELLEAEVPDETVVREVRGLDRILSNLVQNVRILNALYKREDGTMPAAAQTAVDEQTELHGKVKTRRDSVANNIQWPTDSVRHILLTNGEDPQRIRINGSN